MNQRLRIAYFSPLPPARTGIADYSQELLPHLAEHVSLTLFVDRPDEVSPALRREFVLRPMAAYATEHHDYDLALYQMGNSTFHHDMYQIFRHYPGIVVLHDFGLHHYMVYSTAGQGDFAGYVREMGYALGREGIRRARQIRLVGAPYPYFEIPLNNRVLDLALGLIVHSTGVQDAALAQRPDLPVAVVPAPIGPHQFGRPATRPDNWPKDAVVAASLGLVSGSKGIEDVLAVLTQVKPMAPQLRYLLVGDLIREDLDVPRTVQEMGLDDIVCYTGFAANLTEFQAWLETADFVINLRNPTVGETSATALRALAAGRPLIVYNHGWYAELPEEVCLKVPLGDIAALEQAILRLANDAALRQEMGVRAAQYAAAYHTPAHAAQRYLDFIQAVWQRLNT